MCLKEKISRSAEAFLSLRAQNLPLQFYTSTLNGLVDLIEDEIIPTPIPMEVDYFNLVFNPNHFTILTLHEFIRPC